MAHNDDKQLALTVKLPDSLDWEELAAIEDEASAAVGDVLKDHGLVRKSHTRKIEADYSG